VVVRAVFNPCRTAGSRAPRGRKAAVFLAATGRHRSLPAAGDCVSPGLVLVPGLVFAAEQRGLERVSPATAGLLDAAAKRGELSDQQSPSACHATADGVRRLDIDGAERERSLSQPGAMVRARVEPRRGLVDDADVQPVIDGSAPGLALGRGYSP